MKNSSPRVPVEVTVLMPCLNEVTTLPRCIQKIQHWFKQAGVKGEILIADNGSTDGSLEVAQQASVHIIQVSKRGYGSAVLAGIREARGTYTIMGDADDSYDFSCISIFLEQLRNGADLVVGNRFQGGILPEAMPFLHRYLGNPLLSWLGRLLFTSDCRDYHCGLRAFRSKAMQELSLSSLGMELASEMIIKASLAKLKIVEVPVTLYPDGRDRPSHLRAWRDGWRHLCLLMQYVPQRFRDR